MLMNCFKSLAIKLLIEKTIESLAFIYLSISRFEFNIGE